MARASRPVRRAKRTDQFASYWAKTIPAWGHRGTDVEALMADGAQHRGTLARLTSTHLELDTSGGRVVLDLEDLRALQQPLPV